MTIGIFLEHYDPFISGVITSVKTLRQELERRGHKVYIVAPKAGKFKDNDPHVIRIPSITTKYLENTTVGLPNPLTTHQLMKIRFDIIHAQEVFYTCQLGMVIARRQGIPFVQTYHTLWDRFIEQYNLDARVEAVGVISTGLSYPFLFGLSNTIKLFKKDVRYEGSSKHLPNMMWRHMLTMGRSADAVVVPSEHLAKALKVSGLQTSVKVIPNGLSLHKHEDYELLPAKSSDRLRILSVARHSPEKRVNVLIEALAKAHNLDAELILVGEGPTHSQLEELVSERKLGSKVRFMGNLSNAAVREIMRESDILCLASYNFDNQPMVIIEALEAGLPVVYCDPNLKEGLSASNSLLIDKEPDNFAAAYKKLAEPTLRKRMSTASKRLSKNYRIELLVDKVQSVYEQALKES